MFARQSAGNNPGVQPPTETHALPESCQSLVASNRLRRKPNMSLTDYITLGRSGLRVSPLSLGTMTFGTEWGWGSDEPQSREIFDRYSDQGGNFVDTANLYPQAKSKQMLAKFIAAKKL